MTSVLPVAAGHDELGPLGGRRAPATTSATAVDLVRAGLGDHADRDRRRRCPPRVRRVQSMGLATRSVAQDPARCRCVASVARVALAGPVGRVGHDDATGEQVRSVSQEGRDLLPAEVSAWVAVVLGLDRHEPAVGILRDQVDAEVAAQREVEPRRPVCPAPDPRQVERRVMTEEMRDEPLEGVTTLFRGQGPDRRLQGAEVSHRYEATRTSRPPRRSSA